MGKLRTDAGGVVSRAFQLVLLNLPTTLSTSDAEVRAAISERVESLLKHEVRVVLMAPRGTDLETLPVCRDIRGPEKVFLYVLKAGEELIGFGQWGNMVRLASATPQREASVRDRAGGKQDVGPRSVLGPEAILEYVAEPAGIPISDVLVICEVTSRNGFAWGPVLSRFAGAREVALGDAKGLPRTVRRVPPGPESAIALLDSLLWTVG